jgi:hypothetical protein
MSVKIIVTDLDRTLLRSDKTISEYTTSIFQRCRDKGIKIIFATARPIRSVKMLNLSLFFDASIYHNGAVINNGDINILRFGISPEATKEILLSVLRVDNSAKLCVEINDRIFGNFDPSDIWPGVEITITDFLDLPNSPADKIILPMATIAELSSVANVLPNNLYIELSENSVGMIMHKNATKGNAINYLSKHFGLSLSDVAAFGDDYNDLDMIRYCGIGISVANAIDEVKAVADYICDTNDNDGVAKWLEENVL